MHVKPSPRLATANQQQKPSPLRKECIQTSSASTKYGNLNYASNKTAAIGANNTVTQNSFVKGN